jgi:hypothetical protein
VQSHGAITPQGEAQYTEYSGKEELGFESYTRLQQKSTSGFWLSSHSLWFRKIQGVSFHLSLRTGPVLHRKLASVSNLHDFEALLWEKKVR